MNCKVLSEIEEKLLKHGSLKKKKKSNFENSCSLKVKSIKTAGKFLMASISFRNSLV